ncbi:MAG TPA: helix-turn-helix transcriptional regulator [Longimicrobiales bacterium]|nr:helix-turn-helix transcriptional regulator [Longimicrobiales bacterium]
MRTVPEPDFASVATVIGDPARASMLAALMGGEALPAGELASRAAVSAATASSHLSRLVSSGLVTRRRSGRHRFYELASADVAEALESLTRLAAMPARAEVEPESRRALTFARTCYDHLAGRLGVVVTRTLLERGLIAGSGYATTPRGEEWMRGVAIDVGHLKAQRRTLSRPCLDWSERRDHLAGAAGAAIASMMLARRWIVRMDGTRAVRLTVRGRDGLYRSLGLEV